MQKWKKLGLVFCPSNNYDWMVSHAANPVAEHLDEDIFKIYFSCRDNKQRSYVGFVEVDIKPPFKILKISDKIVLAPGKIGLFDDSGISLGCIKKIKGKKYLYYLGWNLAVTVPWRNSIGLAVFNEDTNKFEKYSQAPIIDRNAPDPYSISYPFVFEEEGFFRMWYGSNLNWGSGKEDMAFVIKYAKSFDAIHWEREGKIAINFKDNSENAIARPFVLKENGIYKMWYSFRGSSYRIGYAESPNGLDWQRKDEEAGIDVSENGWDSEMIEYPFIFDHKGMRYMLYNGNSYGRTGFGLAVSI